MKCPACSAELEEIKLGDFALDVCRTGCGGVWFDRDELFKFDEQREFPTSEILKLAQEKAGIKVDHNKIKNCPVCSNEPLVRQFLDIKNEVEMDQCWSCGGVWLDVGEINTLRSQYKTEQDRAKAVNDYVEGKLAETKAQLQENTASQLRTYEQETGNRFKGAILAFKKLLGVDDPYEGL